MAKRVTEPAQAHREEPEHSLRAAIYLRISKDPTGQAAGVTRQQEDCVELADKQGWEVFETYTDNDVSATKKRTRPGYQRMLNDIRAGHIDAVVAWHPDRLYRKLTDLESLVEAIESRNVIMRTVRAGEFDLSTATGRMLARIMSATAQAEVEVKSERWKRSWQQGREAGQIAGTGSRTFGYTQACPDNCETDHQHETRNMHVIDHEAAIARVMAAKIREGGSILGVCRWLAENQVKATRGSAWTPQGVKRYLTNPRLAGLSTLNGEVVADGEWEAILDKDTFETVHAMLTARTREHIPRRSVLLGLIFCGKCGHRLITSKGRAGRNYRCPKRPGMDGCGGISGVAEPVEEVVESFTRTRLENPAVLERIAELQAQPTDLLVEINALAARITELERQLEEPGVPVDAIVRAIGRARDRRAELDGRLADSAVVLPPRGLSWPDDLQRRRALIDLVVERVDLMPRIEGRPNTFGFDPERVQITPR